MLTTRYHLDENHLKYYDEKLKSWALSQPVKTLPSTLYPWVLSEKAGAVGIWPVGGTPLKPVVDFLFAETPPASGDKGPDNPSTITGVSSVNVGRIGKNLLLCPDRPLSYTGYTLSFNADCSYSVNGSGSLFFSVTDGDAAAAGTPSAVVLDENKTYTLSIKLQSGSVSGQAYLTIGIPSGNAVVINLPQTAGTTAKQSFSGSIIPSGRFHCRISASENASFSNAVFFVQLEEGSSETAFEEPMSISDANNTAPLGSTYYGGTLDVASGVLTVTHGRLELNENTGYSFIAGVAESGTIYRLTIYPSSSRNKSSIASQCACNIFPVVTTNTSNITCIRVGSNSSAVNVDIDKSLLGLGDGENYTTVKAAFDSFFSSHPGVFVYPIANPIIVQLDPVSISALVQADKYTPRLNTVYTDAQAVQVGYVKSPIRDEQELTQAITAQGGNI